MVRVRVNPNPNPRVRVNPLVVRHGQPPQVSFSAVTAESSIPPLGLLGFAVHKKKMWCELYDMKD